LADGWHNHLETAAEALEMGDCAEPSLLLKIERSFLSRKRLEMEKNAVLGAPVSQENEWKHRFLNEWKHKLKMIHLKRAQLSVKLSVAPRLRFLQEALSGALPKLLPGLSGPLQGARLARARFLLGTSALHADLVKWNLDIDGDCPCCGKEKETVEHVLLRCSAFSQIRDKCIVSIQESSWGVWHWQKVFVDKGDAAKCATLLGFPAPVAIAHGEGPFPGAISLEFVHDLVESRSRILSETSESEDPEENDQESPNQSQDIRRFFSSTRSESPRPAEEEIDLTAVSEDRTVSGSVGPSSDLSVTNGEHSQDSPLRGVGLHGLTPSKQA
jgi:hypothetical protein